MMLKLWEKAGKKRGYLSEKAICAALSLTIERYKTGNVKHATLDGEEISNSECGRILGRFENQFFDFISGSWSFDTSEGYGKIIDEYFRSVGEI